MEREAEPNDPQQPTSRTVPSGHTRETEREDAQVVAGADRPPTEDEERHAATSVTDEQRAHEQEMAERGAHQQGEGRIS